MNLFLLLLASVHPGGPPSDWLPLPGSDSIRFRWSLPASNSCLVEFQNNDPLHDFRISAKATYASNRTQMPVKSTGQTPAPQAPTIVRERKEQKNVAASMRRLSTYVVSITDCYRIDKIAGSVTSDVPDQQSVPATTEKPK